MNSDEDLGNISDELLALAGGDRKRKGKHDDSSKPSAKRRKPEAADSDMEFESEEDDSNPYPIEGKYKNEADRQSLLEMPEIEREGILAQRLEEMQRHQDKLNLDKMVKAQNGIPEPEAKSVKRKQSRGMTKEKSRALDQLKAKRKAKDDRAVRPAKDNSGSPTRKRARSSSASDYSGDDDGEPSKLEDDDKPKKPVNTTAEVAEVVTSTDLDKVRVTRDTLAKHCLAPWFEDFVKGTWVRYLIGNENGQSVYRVCEIINLGAELVRPYSVSNQMINQTIELKHGKSVRTFPMDKVSNSQWTQKEFDRLAATMTFDKVKFPSKRAIEQKASQMEGLITKPLTEGDISAMIARRNQLQPPRQSAQQLSAEKSRLYQSKDLALKRNDFAEAALIDKQISHMEALSVAKPELEDRLAKVNERNRKANLEAIRKAEAIESERKRRERRERTAQGGTPGPSDPSARLKTVPRVFTDTRAGTPTTGSSSSITRVVATAATVPNSPITSKRNFDSIMVNSIDIDLGDF